MDQEPDYGEPEHEPTREQQEGDAWEYWHQRASELETKLHYFRWHQIDEEVPQLDEVVVCTDGTHRWLDKRTPYDLEMKWQGHKPTHWHPIAPFTVDNIHNRARE